ncbi:fungal-specific transcription factor domain-domain-containing protein [Naematelia encephala]|uniref:Fungal-specific transcription factor domain-domain-containing protein n=1 Tax=Naematelia encephala TaxID=71784 RepID=A0A1Y2BC13_9TREE|nr:fungal-specific transcription factor domain-domain-containing protein [Naematelia encephala]
MLDFIQASTPPARGSVKERSRGGCSACRVDKKKCDEVKPACGRCYRLNKSCVFDRNHDQRLRNKRRKTSNRNTESLNVPDIGDVELANDSHPSSSGRGLPRDATETRTFTLASTGEDSDVRSLSPGTSDAQVHAMSTIAAIERAPMADSAIVNDEPDWTDLAAFSMSLPLNACEQPMQGVPNLTNFDLNSSGSSIIGMPTVVAVDNDPPVRVVSASTSMNPDADTFNFYETSNVSGAEVDIEQQPSRHQQTSQSYHQIFSKFDLLTALTSSSSIQKPDFADDFQQAALELMFPAPPETVLADPTLRHDHHELVHHYFNVQSRIAVSCDGPTNPLRTRLIDVTTRSHLSPDADPGLHAFLAAAASNLASLRSSVGLVSRIDELWVMAKKSKVKAVRLLMENLRRSQGVSPSHSHSEMIANTTALLFMVATTTGDTRIFPTVRDACLAHLRQSEQADLSTIEAHQYSKQHQVSLFLISAYDILAGFTGHPASTSYPDFNTPSSDMPDIEGVSTIWGFNHGSWRLLKTALDLLRRKDAPRKDAFVDLSIFADASELEDELEKPPDFSTEKLGSVEIKRVIEGSKMLRSALHILLLREIYGVNAHDYRVQAQVKDTLASLASIPRGQEVGLLLTLVIVGSSALGEDRIPFMLFGKRATWKGTAGPKLAFKILTEVWEDPEAKTSWRDKAIRYGSPIFV